jgi:hypothetical protein
MGPACYEPISAILSLLFRSILKNEPTELGSMPEFFIFPPQNKSCVRTRQKHSLKSDVTGEVGVTSGLCTLKTFNLFLAHQWSVTLSVFFSYIVFSNKIFRVQEFVSQDDPRLWMHEEKLLLKKHRNPGQASMLDSLSPLNLFLTKT